ncbi:MAG: tRNA (adenosine(37)-N6)-dimethylallyltransferase MiaA [Moraxella sp.]|uniref:tRNA (adenosine(37)-N6)-dimethylallyltransferase MiaA n=1 Tax=Moraxella sp. TaxID=479 RepID=UPI0026DB2836|nr:tRNA (adenosine(37)-N6)-dimethylallyltransferase MiaA [Moraxella sp.]MDO4449507.1 tRNA (adenosine(37)-N6)-dimethylallyltransferase MiaA [Moraxella sp.]
MNLNYKNLPDNTVLSLIAPTASGKTDLAFELYQTGRFELVSVDSALIYQDMNIGTAKPTKDELANYPHYLVDIITPLQTYNVASFVSDVERLIDNIHQNGKIPLLVGGTMMYYMALLDGLSAVPDTDPAIRTQVMAWLDERGIGDLYAYLQTHDPKICERLKVSDTQRITRAVEVHLQTGTPMSVWQAIPKTAPCHNPAQRWLTLSVEPDRAWLHERIERRLNLMWEHGLVDEVIQLLQTYPELTPDMPSMRCVGYRQVLEFLAMTGHDVMQISPIWQQFTQDVQKTHTIMTKKNNNFVTNPQKLHNLACQDMKNKALYATRQLAKRQATWQRSLARLNHAPTITQTTQGVYRPVMLSFDGIQQVQEQLLY